MNEPIYFYLVLALIWGFIRYVWDFSKIIFNKPLAADQSCANKVIAG